MLLNLLLLPFQFVTVLVVGVLLRRLLGVRVGFVRMVLAGLVALWAAGTILTATVPSPGAVENSSAFLYLLLSAGAGSLLAMVLLVVAEVLVPEGSLPGPVEPGAAGEGGPSARDATRRSSASPRVTASAGSCGGDGMPAWTARLPGETWPDHCEGRWTRPASPSSSSASSSPRAATCCLSSSWMS